MKKIFFIYLVLLTVLHDKSLAQDNTRKRDSLLQVLRTAKPDTNKIQLYMNLTRAFMGSQDTLAVKFSQLGVRLADSLKHKRGAAKCWQNMGVAYHNLGKYPEAIEAYLNSLKLREEMNDKAGAASIYNNIGNIVGNQGKVNEAFENYNKALGLYLQLIPEIPKYKNKEVVYEIKRGFTNTYSNLGNVYRYNKELDKANENYLKALKIREEIGDEQGISICYICLGMVAEMTGDYDRSIGYQTKAYAIQQKTGDKYNMTYTLMSLGTAYLQKKQYARAIEYLDKNAELCKEIGAPQELYGTYNVLASVYEAMGDYKKAFEYYRMFSVNKDSLLTKENASIVTEMQTKYNTEKKEKEILLLNKDKALQQSQIEKEKTFRNSLIGVVGLIVILLVVAIRAYFAKKRSNELLNAKNNEIEFQKLLVETAYGELHEKNKEILDSIYYARRIQRALLTNESYIVKHMGKLK